MKSSIQTVQANLQIITAVLVIPNISYSTFSND